MGSFKAVTMSKQDGRPAAAVHAIPDWEGFEKLIKFVEKHHGARVIEQVDGPDARKAVIEVDGKRLELHHEDGVGNTLISTGPDADAMLRVIADDLGKRLAGLKPG